MDEPQANKKKILFVITQSEFGGAQKFLLSFVNRLDRNKYEIAIAVGKDGDDNLTEMLKDYRLIRIEHLKRNISFFEEIKSILEVRNIIKKFNPNSIFLLSSKAGFIGSVAARWPFRIKGLRVIYRIGGWTFNDPWPHWKKLFFRILEKASARWKDVIIVNNQFDLNQALKFKIKPRQKMALIHNGLDVYKTNYFDREEARLKLFEKISKINGRIFQVRTLIGTIANFYPTKGLSYLIEAAEHFKNDEEIVFCIIGDGQLRNEICKLIKEKELEKKIYLLGKINDAYRYLPAFDVFVLPSLKEGFPWSLIEAMSAKVPVIATSVGAVPEIIESGKNGIIVEPGNSEQIAKSIKEILAKDHLRQELGIQGHQTVLFNFDLDKMVSQTEMLL